MLGKFNQNRVLNDINNENNCWYKHIFYKITLYLLPEMNNVKSNFNKKSKA